MRARLNLVLSNPLVLSLADLPIVVNCYWQRIQADPIKKQRLKEVVLITRFHKSQVASMSMQLNLLERLELTSLRVKPLVKMAKQSPAGPSASLQAVSLQFAALKHAANKE